MNNKLKLMQIAVCLAAVSIAALAEDLETKSGNTFNNYSITGQKGSNVTVSHTGGVTVVPISDLPDRVAWPYVKSKVEDMIYDAKQAKTLDQAEHKLKEILRQYPASEELVKEELVQIQKKKEIEKQIAEILRSGTMDDQLGELRKLLEKHRENPELKQKIDYQIAVQLSTQKKLADTLARKLQEAEKELDLEKALNQLRALLKAHPNHPYSAQQQEYAERMDRLISAREAEYKKYQERRQEIRQQLQGIWQLNFTEKRTQWQSIFKSLYAANQITCERGGGVSPYTLEDNPELFYAATMLRQFSSNNYHDNHMLLVTQTIKCIRFFEFAAKHTEFSTFRAILYDNKKYCTVLDFKVLGTSVFDVGVQVPSSAPYVRLFKSQ